MIKVDIENTIKELADGNWKTELRSYQLVQVCRELLSVRDRITALEAENTELKSARTLLQAATLYMAEQIKELAALLECAQGDLRDACKQLDAANKLIADSREQKALAKVINTPMTGTAIDMYLLRDAPEGENLLYAHPLIPAEQDKLTKPARVGATVFEAGVDSRLVIECANHEKP